MARIHQLASVPALVVLFGASSAAAQRRGHHVHDGFYFRGSIGVGTFAVDQESDFGDVPDGRVTGPGGASDLMIGGTPVRGLAVGGRATREPAPDPQFESDRLSVDPNVDATWVIIGPFVDFFVIPSKGFPPRRCARRPSRESRPTAARDNPSKRAAPPLCATSRRKDLRRLGSEVTGERYLEGNGRAIPRR